MQIYMTVNRLSGKFYIGQCRHTNECYLGSGLLINKAIKKYGWWNFYKIILEDKVESNDELNRLEIKWISHYRKLRKHLMYNIAAGGYFGDTMSYHPDRQKIIDKILETKKAKPYKHTEEALRKIGKASRERLVSDLTRARQSKALTGLKRSVEACAVISIRAKGNNYRKHRALSIFGITFKHIKLAAEILDIPKTSIHRRLHSTEERFAQYIWLE